MGREFTYLFKELMPVSLITAAVLIISRGIGGLYRYTAKRIYELYMRNIDFIKEYMPQ